MVCGRGRDVSCEGKPGGLRKEAGFQLSLGERVERRKADSRRTEKGTPGRGHLSRGLQVEESQVCVKK